MTAEGPLSGPAVEVVLARHTVRRTIYVGPVLVALAGLLRGWDGVIASALGLAVVVGNFLLAGAILAVAARISLAMYHAAALFGFFLRLALIAGTMLAIVGVVAIDRPAFGITAVVAYMVLLAWEALAVARGRERELEWIQ